MYTVLTGDLGHFICLSGIAVLHRVTYNLRHRHRRHRLLPLQWKKKANGKVVVEMLGELEWQSLDRSSLLLCHKIHSSAVSTKKTKNLTPAHSLTTTKASHSAQYCRYPELFHSGIVFHLRWSIPRLQGSLWHSSFCKKHIRKIFVVFVFCCCFLFCFLL